MANPRWGLVRTSAIIPQNDFLGADLSPLCTESRLWNPVSAQWNPITQAMNFIKKKSRAGEQEKKKKRSNHPSVESLSLPCVEVQLNTEQSREASSIPGKIFITATNFQVSRTGEQDSLRESSHFWFHALSRISLHGMETHSPPPPPNPCFSIVPAVFFPQWQPENMQ